MEKKCPFCSSTMSPMKLSDNFEGFFALNLCQTKDKKVLNQIPTEVTPYLCPNCNYLALFKETKKPNE